MLSKLLVGGRNPGTVIRNLRHKGRLHLLTNRLVVLHVYLNVVERKQHLQNHQGFPEGKPSVYRSCNYPQFCLNKYIFGKFQVRCFQNKITVLSLGAL